MRSQTIRSDQLLTRDLGTPLDVRDATPRPATFDAAARSIEAIIASNAPVPRQDTRGAFVEVLDPTGLDIAASRGASVLDSHRQGGLDAVLGTLDDIRIEGGQVIGLIRFSSRPEIAPIIDDVRTGVISHLSVGYQVSAWRDGTNANGMRTRTATRWVIKEASFVPVPADGTARTRHDARSEARNETQRLIHAMGARAGIGPELVSDLITRGASIEEARSQILFELQCRSAAQVVQSAHNRSSFDDPANRVRAFGEALFARATPSHRPSPMAQAYVGLTIPEIARECLSRAGLPTYGMGSAQVIERALHTTSDFALILADTVGRTLRQSYDSATSAVRQLAREASAPDFRTRHRLMLDSSGMTLEKVSEAGEFKSGTMSESEETYKLDTFGRVFGISRQALVNDDIGAFTDLTRRLGQAAANFEAQFLVDLLISNAGLGPVMSDGAKLFDAAHGNMPTNGGAPSETTLSAARLAMRRQRGPDGGLIIVEPAFVLVPPEMETSTEKLLTQIRAIQVSDVNVFAQLRLVVEPRLTDAKRWYVVASPDRVDGLEYSYLAGQPGPQVESRVGFEVDGVQIKVRVDFGAGAIDHRGWYSDAGE